MPSGHQETQRHPDRSRLFHCSNSSAQAAFRRLTTLADSPLACSPSSSDSASPMSPVDTPRRYSHGSDDDTRGDLRTQGGTIDELNLTPVPERSRTFGTWTGTGPTAVTISRSGR